MAGEYLVLGKRPSNAIVASVVAIAAGAVIAGAGDLQFSMTGYLLGTLSCISQGTVALRELICFVFSLIHHTIAAGYLTYVAKREEESGMSTFGLLYYNCTLSLPFVLLFVVGSGELSTAIQYPLLFSLKFQVRYSFIPHHGVQILMLVGMFVYGMFIGSISELFDIFVHHGELSTNFDSLWYAFISFFLRDILCSLATTFIVLQDNLKA